MFVIVLLLAFDIHMTLAHEAKGSVSPGSDGKTWYWLGYGSWVRSDLVDLSGDCANLPIVTDEE